jgi:hypothetical protein
VNLGDELRTCVEELAKMIEAVKVQAEEAGIDPYRMTTPSGVPVLAPLLAAKGDCLSALARHPGADVR